MADGVVAAVVSVVSTVGSSVPASNTWVAPNTSTTTRTTPAPMVHLRRVAFRLASQAAWRAWARGSRYLAGFFLHLRLGRHGEPP